MTLSEHIDKGRCTGLPMCCVLFFVLFWHSPRWMHGEPKGWRALYNRLLFRGVPPPPWPVGSNPVRWWGYVPCPKCLALNHRVTPRRCDDTCGHLSA